MGVKPIRMFCVRIFAFFSWLNRVIDERAWIVLLEEELHEKAFGYCRQYIFSVHAGGG